MLKCTVHFQGNDAVTGNNKQATAEDENSLLVNY